MVNTLLLLALSAASGLQDPTRPLSPQAVITATETRPDRVLTPRLEAIFSGGGRASAILDGRRYHAGDAVGEYRLVRISRDQVLLEGQGESLELTLFPSLSILGSQ
ncbi:MSHA biogenesis protein MshK [Zobellella sp. An-6]|uniref:MSHA biogenesis protein MshK n=1 Tax=Zobellella sp. An-6 TaxID=3400218 RepID=UPI00404200FC